MPHKANPVRATLIASAARQLPGLAAVLFSAMTAEDERPTGAWHAEWQPLREALRLAAGAAADAVELVDGLRVDTARMRAHLDLTRGLVVSERFVDALAPALGRRNARAVLASASRDAVADGVDLATALARQPELAARPSSGGGTGTGIDAAQLASLLDPAAYLGVAPDLTDRALRRRPAPDQPRTERPYQDMKP
jgi:3-carboxy-cis,cis-muconate cycloisomerase